MKVGDKVKYIGSMNEPLGNGEIKQLGDDSVFVYFDCWDERWVKKEFLVVVNNAIIPDHYKQGNIDTIAFCESFFSKEQLRGAYRFNVIKYNHRYLDKNGLEDLKKAEFYLQKLIELENTNETD